VPTNLRPGILDFHISLYKVDCDKSPSGIRDSFRDLLLLSLSMPRGQTNEDRPVPPFSHLLTFHAFSIWSSQSLPSRWPCLAASLSCPRDPWYPRNSRRQAIIILPNSVSTQRDTLMRVGMMQSYCASLAFFSCVSIQCVTLPIV